MKVSSHVPMETTDGNKSFNILPLTPTAEFFIRLGVPASLVRARSRDIGCLVLRAYHIDSSSLRLSLQASSFVSGQTTAASGSSANAMTA